MTVRNPKRPGGAGCQTRQAIAVAGFALGAGLLGFSMPLLAADAEAAAGTAADGSYGIGFGMGSNLRQQGIEGLDLDALIKGLRDGAAGKAPGLTPEQLQAGIQQLQMATLDKQRVAGEQNLSKAAQWLADNGKRKGVITTASGLQYEVLASGDGAMPTVDDQVTTHYHGTFLDGSMFDSSVERGEPATFPVSGVIPGWTEALQLMHVGDKWRLFIPPGLAYGERGAGSGQIPPNSALIFDLELLGVEGK